MQWHPGHVAKAKKRISELVKAVNYIIEIRDARAPFATSAYDREKLFKGRKTIIVLNKADIADDKITEEWLDYYRERKEKVIVSQKGDRSKSLIKKLFGDKVRANVLVVGMPNVGKSTFINRLKGRRSAKVGAVPGVTKGAQWIQINERIKIVDTPGIIYSDIFNKELAAKLVLTGVFPTEKVEEWDVLQLAFEIIKKKHPDLLDELSNNLSSFGEFIEIYAKKRGFLLKGGKVDVEKAKNVFIQEVYTGRLGRMSFETPTEILELQR